MVKLSPVHRYEDGPTTCRPAAAVLKEIQRAIKASHALSSADVRLAAYMGLVTADVQRPIGFNDGVFYPPESVTLSSAPEKSPLRAARMQRASATSTRKLHAIALLVDFSDNTGTRPAADFQAMLFDPNNPDSMTSIYREMSYGMLEVSGEVVGYVRAPKPYSFYTAGDSGTGSNFPRNTPGLLFDALTEFCKADDLKRFDTDGDGFVDGVFLVHAGGGAEASPDPVKRKDMIWSHKWTLPQAFKNKGVSVFAYSTEPEDGKVGAVAIFRRHAGTQARSVPVTTVLLLAAFMMAACYAPAAAPWSPREPLGVDVQGVERDDDGRRRWARTPTRCWPHSATTLLK